MSALALASMAAATLVVGCGGSPCDAGDLAARLAAAQPGEIVEAPGCTLEAALTVPAGVTLRGSSSTRLVGPTDGPAVTLATGAAGTTGLASLTIESHHTGLAVSGDGDARVSEVTVEAITGVGAALATSGLVTLTGSTLRGTVTEANRDDSRWLSVTASDAPTHGLVASTGRLALSSSRVEGFAEVAVALGGGMGGEPDLVSATIEGTTIGHGLGVGLTTRAGTLTLTDAHIEDVWTGVRGWPSYCGFVEAGTVSSSGLALSRCDGYGLVQIAGDTAHSALTITTTGDVGLWVGAGASASVEGGSRIADTAFAAITAVDAASLSLADVDVAEVRAVRRTVLVRGAIEIGDGIDLVGTSFSLRNVTIASAERVGLLVDASAFSAADLSGITVTSEGTGLGALLGSIDRGAEQATVTTMPGWDSGITRAGAAITNDAAFTGSLAAIVAPGPPSAGDVLGVIAPMY